MADVISRPIHNSVVFFICFWAEISLPEEKTIFAQHPELQCCRLVSFFSSPKLSIPLTNAPVRWLIWKWAAENFHRLSNARSHYPLLLLLHFLRCTRNLCKCIALLDTLPSTVLLCYLILCYIVASLILSHCNCVTWYSDTVLHTKPAWYLVTVTVLLDTVLLC